jgi:hypothetical protein
MTDDRLPHYSGGGLLNLVAELERRMVGDAPSEGLSPETARMVPEADTYVLALFDGLGDHQLEHPVAAPLRASRQAALDAGFPTTTSVNLATVATGLSPAGHGLIAHQLFVPAVEQVVNTLKWTTPWGDDLPIDHEGFLPSPNLWERLREGGVEPITVQPANFQDSPLSRVLYRSARYEPVWTVEEIVDATVQLAAQPGRLIFTYFPNVDVAAHMHGQASDEYAATLAAASAIWERIDARLPGHAAMVGTADHGHIDYSPAGKFLIPHRPGPEFYGDPRCVLVRRLDDELVEAAAGFPGRIVEPDDYRTWLGPGPDHPDLTARLPELALMADRGRLLIPRFMDKRLIGYHGGLLEAEMRVPLLVAPS